jgi:acetyl-CoA/propionyl-CoA carboxylase biotin carboxyl carrier protein
MVDASSGAFYFLEMNCRIQVEHPVTEAVTGRDLVAEQLRIAAGEPLSFGQDDVRLDGHAVEARIYAEDPSRGFLPTGGRVLSLREPTGPGIRVDSGLAPGATIGSEYDPLLAKVIAYGPDRDTALRRLDTALAGTSILGLGVNTGFLRALLADSDVRAGRLDTGLVERRVDGWVGEALPDDVAAAAGLLALLALEPSGPVVDPFALPGGWRVGEPAWTHWRLLATDPVEIHTRGRAGAAHVAVGQGKPVPASVWWDGGDLVVTLDGITRRYTCARDGAVVWLGRDGHSWALRELEGARRVASDGAGAGPVLAPMPGTVTAVEVDQGQQVIAGARLLVIEAMKMEHVLTAPIDGVVRELHARPGGTVERDAVLAVVEPACTR